MTKLEFIALCGEYGIEPAIVLENDAIIDALQSRDDQKVVKLLIRSVYLEMTKK